MAYIGKKPSDITRAIATYDTFTGDGSTTTFDLSQAASSANDIIVLSITLDKSQALQNHIH